MTNAEITYAIGSLSGIVEEMLERHISHAALVGPGWNIENTLDLMGRVGEIKKACEAELVEKTTEKPVKPVEDRRCGTCAFWIPGSVCDALGVPLPTGTDRRPCSQGRGSHGPAEMIGCDRWKEGHR